MRNKRANYTADSTITYIVYGIVINILLIALVLLFYKDASATTKIPPGTETYLLYQRFLMSPDCFVSKETAGQYSGTIVWDKFTQDSLRACYWVDENSEQPAFRLQLKIPSISEQTGYIKTNNWDDSIGPKKREAPKSVQIDYNNKIYQGEMIIEEQNVKN